MLESGRSGFESSLLLPSSDASGGDLTSELIA